MAGDVLTTNMFKTSEFGGIFVHFQTFQHAIFILCLRVQVAPEWPVDGLVSLHSKLDSFAVSVFVFVFVFVFAFVSMHE